MLNKLLTARGLTRARYDGELSMRIWSIMLASTGLALGLSVPAMAGESAPAGATLPMMGKAGFSGRTVHRSGPRVQGRWFAGWRAPGGWAAYRRPVVGYVLPSYWISPAYRIGNYGAYGLPAPETGYRWSRYYDDAVMTDDQGRVRDHRSDVRWDNDDRRDPPYGANYDDDVTVSDAPPPHEYEGRWTGTWRDEKGRTYSGEYEGRFEGEARSNYGVDYDAPPYAAAPQVIRQGGAGQPMVTTTHAPGYYANGYYYPGPTTTTIVVQPVMTTTRTYVTSNAAPRHHAHRKAHRDCNCK